MRLLGPAPAVDDDAATKEYVDASSGGAPSGGAGGVLSGTYPNPGFAVDMAEQGELDTVAGAKADKATTIAGLDLSTNRTAAALRAALGISWVTIVDQDLVGLSTLSVNVTGYRRLRFSIVGATARAATLDSVLLRFNADSGSSYTVNAGAAATSATFVVMPGSSTNSNRMSLTTCEIVLGSSAYTVGTFQGVYMLSNGTTDQNTAFGRFSWLGSLTNAVTAMSVTTAIGSLWLTGSRIIVEGIV